MTAPAILFLTSDLHDLDGLSREAAQLGTFTFEPCPSPASLLDRLDGQPYLGVLIDSGLAAAVRREAIVRVREAAPTLPIVALTGPSDGDAALQAGATAFVNKRGDYAVRVVGVFQAWLEAHAGTAPPSPVDAQFLAFGLTPGQTRAFDRAGLPVYAATVGPDGLVLADGALADPAAFDGALVSEAGLGQQACEVLVDIRARAPFLALVALASGETATVSLAAERLGGTVVKAADDQVAGALAPLVPALQARRSAVDDLMAVRSSELRVRAVVESTPSGILLLDAEGTCLAVNWAALSLLGRDDAQHIVGANFGEAVDPADAEAFGELLRSVSAGTRHEVSIVWSRAEGDPVQVRLCGVPLPRNGDETCDVLCSIEPVPAAAPVEAIDVTVADDHANELAALRDELEGMRQERDTLTSRLASFSQERDELAARTVALEQERDALADPSMRVDVATAEARSAEAVQAAMAEWEMTHQEALNGLQLAVDAARGDAESAREAAAQSEQRLAESAELKQRCDLLETWLREAEARCDELHRELASRPTEPVMAEPSPSVLAEIEQLREALAASAERERESEHLAGEHAALVHESAELRSRHDTVAIHAAALELELSDARTALEAERARVAAEQRHAHTLEDQVGTLTAALREAEAAHAQLQETSGALGERDAELARLSTRIAEVAAAEHGLRARADELAQALSLESEHRRTAEAALEAASREVDARRAALNDAQALGRELDTLRGQLSEAQAQAREVDALRAELSDAQALGRELDTLRAELSDARAQAREVDALRAELSEAQTQAQADRSAVTELGERARAAEAHATEARSQLDELSSQRSALQQTLAERSADLAQLRRELEALGTRFQTAAAEASAAKTAAEEHREDLRAAAAKAESLEAAVSALQAEVATAEAARTDLQRVVAGLRDELTAVSAERDRATNALAAAAAEAERHHAQLADATTRAQHAADALARTAAETAAAQAHAAALSASHERALARVAELEAQVADAVSHRVETEQALQSLHARFDDERFVRARLESALAQTSEQGSAASDLRQQLAALETSLTEAVSRAEVLGEQMRTAQRDRDHAVAERDRLAANLERHVEGERRARADAAARAGDEARLRTELDAALASRAAAQRDVDRMLEEVGTLRARLVAEADARRSEASTVAELKSHQATAERLRRELEQAMTELTDQRRQLDEYRGLHTSLEAGLRSAEAALDQLTDTQRHERSRADALGKELERTRRALRDRERDLSRVKVQAQTARETIERERAATRAEAASRRTVEQTADARLREHERSLTQHQRTIDELGRRIREHENRWSSFWHEAPIGLATTTPDGHVVAANPLLAAWLGREKDRGGREARLPVVAVGEGESATHQFTLTCRDGQMRHFVEHAACRRQGGDLIVERMLVDVSPAHNLGAALREARRFESVGRLTMRMVDDLCALVERVDGLARHSDRRTGRSVGPLGADLAEAAGRTAALVRQLQQHAKRQMRNEPEVETGEVVRSLLPVLQRVTGEDIAWEVQEGSGDALAVERHAFEHLMTALALAVRETLPEGGTATLDIAPSSASARVSDAPALTLTATGYGLCVAADEGVRHAAARCGVLVRTELDAHECRWEVTLGPSHPAGLPLPSSLRRAS